MLVEALYENGCSAGLKYMDSEKRAEKERATSESTGEEANQSEENGSDIN